jgi:hypothetical protein
MPVAHLRLRVDLNARVIRGGSTSTTSAGSKVTDEGCK